MTLIGPRDGCIELLISDKQNCFGRSPNNDKGLHMKFYTNKDVDVVVSWFTVPPDYCGWGPVVYGGVVYSDNDVLCARSTSEVSQ